jgi:ABC-type glycerol-3-phosphate transport system substrate-binding protein
MPDIEFSHFRPDLDLASLQQAFRNPVKLRHLGMDNAWPELLQYALRLEGPDVSEVGMTWLGSLSGMQVLRPFTPVELRSIRGQGSFIEIPWENCQYDGGVIAIPWHMDTRLFYYRRDIFEKVGIDESNAFASPEQFSETLLKLKAGGYAYPWLVTTSNYVLQYIAPWLWWYGAAFRSEDGHKITLVEPEALKGLMGYFENIRLLPPYVTTESDGNLNSRFWAGEVPLMYNGDWFYREFLRNPPDWADSLGAAPVPGQANAGVMYLSIWRHSIYENQALDLIRFLTNHDVSRELFERYRMIPPHLDLLNAPPFTTDPVFKVIAQSLKNGRAFKNIYRWAGVENRLNSVFVQLMADLINKPELNLETELETRMRGIKAKLERTILA